MMRKEISFPLKIHAPITQLSLQGLNIDALSEWFAFTNTYDHDLAIAARADEAMKAGRPWNLPENYNIIDMTINLDAGYLKLENAYGSYRYSLKEFFDPIPGAISSDTDYTQWNYIWKDGQTVLLVLSEETARIFADLPDAFVSIHVNPVTLVDGKEAPLTENALEQLSELFGLSIKPQQNTGGIPWLSRTERL